MVNGHFMDVPYYLIFYMDKRTILLTDYSFVFLLFGPKTKSNETKRLCENTFRTPKIYFGPKLISCYISLYDHGNLNKLVKIYQLNFYSKQAFQLLGSGALQKDKRIKT